MSSDHSTSTDVTTQRKHLLDRIGLPLPAHSGYRLLREADRWFHLGDQLIKQSRPEAALAAFDQAQQIEPNNANFTQTCAIVLAALKRPHAALDLLKQLPPSPDTLAACANLHIDMAAPDLALALCDQALTMQNNHFVAQLNRGVALRALKRLPEVLINDATLVAKHPQHPIARYNHGDALLANGHFPEALTELDHCLRLAPNHAPAMMARGLALAMLHDFPQADAVFAETRKNHPEAAAAYLKNAARAAELPDDIELPTEAKLIYLSWAMQALGVCNWRESEFSNKLLLELFSATPANSKSDTGLAFNALLYSIPERIQQNIARQAAIGIREKATRWGLEYPLHKIPPRSITASQARRLKIGFLSPDFRPHPVGDSHWRQLQLHDRSRFEIFAYSLFDAGTSAARTRISQSCDHFSDVSRLSSSAIAQRIAADGIDILIDLSGYTEHTRPEILAARPAPLQVQHMGTPGSCGANFIDYRLTDTIVNPPDSAVWDEHFVWLPETFWLADDTQIIGPTPSRTQCGLPESGFVFCCFNTHQKLEPVIFALWMRLLSAIPDSVLWLTQGSELSRKNLRTHAADHGVAPERLIFAERIAMDQHLARHRCADLFLDTFIYNAHVTALNAWQAGLPVLTCLGQHMAGRMGASAAMAVGLPEMITASPAEYEQRALHLATHPDELHAIRQKLARVLPDAPLFQTARRVRQIEMAYEQMWGRYIAGLPAQSFEIAP